MLCDVRRALFTFSRECLHRVAPTKHRSVETHIHPLLRLIRTVYDGRGVYHPACAEFSWSISPQLKQYRCPKRRRWKHLADSCPKTYRSMLAPSWLSSNRAWKTAPGVCDIYRRLRYLLPSTIHQGTQVDDSYKHPAVLVFVPSDSCTILPGIRAGPSAPMTEGP